MQWLFRITIALTLMAGPSQAAILFLELSPSLPEYQVTVKEAQERHEALISIPTLSAADRSVMHKGRTLPENYGERQQLLSAVNEISKRRKIPNINTRLSSEIARIERKGDQVSTLIIQSHSVGSDFFGNFVEIGATIDSIAKVFSKFPKSRKSLRSVYLWGCYTGTLESLLKWKKAFPKLPLLFGFYGSAPSSRLDASHRLLEYFLSHEREFLATSALKQLTDQVLASPDARQTKVALSVKSLYYSHPTGSIHLKEAYQECYKMKELPGYKLFKSYWAAHQKGFENPPLKTQGTPLREFYNHVQRYGHCKGLLKDFPEATDVWGLLFFNEIKSKWEQEPKNVQLIRGLRTLSLEKRQKIRLPGQAISQLTRHQIVKYAHWLEDAIRQTKVNITQWRPSEINLVFDFIDELVRLKDIKGIPVEWIGH